MSKLLIKHCSIGNAVTVTLVLWADRCSISMLISLLFWQLQRAGHFYYFYKYQNFPKLVLFLPKRLLFVCLQIHFSGLIHQVWNCFCKTFQTGLINHNVLMHRITKTCMFGRNTPYLMWESFSLAADSSVFITCQTRIKFLEIRCSHYFSHIIVESFSLRALECIFSTSVVYNRTHFCSSLALLAYFPS